MAASLWSPRSALRRLVGAETEPKPKDEPASSADAPNPFQAGVDRIRSVASWLVGALAAVATVMLAGSQLSTIGSLSVTEDTERLGGAVAAALVAVGAVAYAVYRLTIIQMPGEGTLAAIREQAADPTSVIAVTAAGDSGLRAYRPNVAKLLTDYEELRKAEYDAEVAVEQAKAALMAATNDAGRAQRNAQLATAETALSGASAEVKVLRPHVVHLAQFASYVSVRKRFEDGRRRVLFAALVAAGAIVAFAWAANPDKPEPGASPAAPQAPSAAWLLLTPEGQTNLSELLGDDCAADAVIAPGIAVIALSSSGDDIEVVVVPRGSCTAPVKLTVEKDDGQVVSQESVDLPEQ